LLDTHTFLWAVSEPARIPRRVLAALQRRTNELHLSAVSIWEMAIKRSIGKLSTDIGIGELIELGQRKMQLQTMDVTAGHALLVETLPWHHRDPFDRLLIAQALWEDITVVGADSRFDDYSAKRLW
jgi:PIN domain nuclease of toxin-antitoxin system